MRQRSKRPGISELLFATVVVAILGLANPGSARININTEALNKSVAFIYGANQVGENANPSAPLGTGVLYRSATQDKS